jgi:two-component system, sporulation sensor kinase A
MKDFKQLEKNEIFDDLFDNSLVAVVIVDKKRKIRLANNSFCKMFGYSQEEVFNKETSLLHINNEKFHDFKALAFDKIIKKEPVSIAYEFKKKDGTRFWAKISGHPAKNEHNIVWMLVDITETMEIKNKFQEQTLLLETVMNENPNPIVLKNYDAKFILVNTATANLYNSTPTQMIGKDDGDYIPDKKLADFFKKNVQEIMDKEETQIIYEDSIDVRTNEIRNYMSIKKPFKNKHGEKFILVIANDITELNQKNIELLDKEKLLFQQNKLASMGEMIGNIAHQWRQPLSMISIQATSTKLEKELGTLSDEDLISTMEKINNTTQYLSKIIDDFRYFHNPKNNTLSTFNINDTIIKTLNLANFEDIKVIKEIDNLEIKSLENELIQVLLNILNNAKDAMIKNETKRYIKIKIYKINNTAYIEIIDTANGIPLDIIDKVFEPYFTTKHKSKGTGIGLFMTEEIVIKHLNGKISVKNDKIKIDNIEYFGANFTIELPLGN